MASTENYETILIYVPVNTTLVIEKEFKHYDFSLVYLVNRYIARPDVQVKDGKTIIDMHNFLEDILVITRRKLK